jgi:hypothetical protein
MGILPVLAVPPACSMMKAMGKHSYSTRSFPFGESAATDKETVLQQLQLQSSTQRVKLPGQKIYRVETFNKKSYKNMFDKYVSFCLVYSENIPY